MATVVVSLLSLSKSQSCFHEVNKFLMEIFHAYDLLYYIVLLHVWPGYLFLHHSCLLSLSGDESGEAAQKRREERQIKKEKRAADKERRKEKKST